MRSWICLFCLATLTLIALAGLCPQGRLAVAGRPAPAHWVEDPLMRVRFLDHRLAMDMRNENDQVDRAISTGKLHALPHFHTRPINVVVFHGSDREYSFSGGFPA
jgi:hypothetical protein